MNNNGIVSSSSQFLYPLPFYPDVIQTDVIPVRLLSGFFSSLFSLRFTLGLFRHGEAQSGLGRAEAGRL